MKYIYNGATAYSSTFELNVNCPTPSLTTIGNSVLYAVDPENVVIIDSWTNFRGAVTNYPACVIAYSIRVGGNPYAGTKLTIDSNGKFTVNTDTVAVYSNVVIRMTYGNTYLDTNGFSI